MSVLLTRLARRSSRVAGAALALSSALAFAASARLARAQDLPAGFEVTTFVEGLDQPVAMDFAPDGRLFVAERDGRVRIVQDGILRPDVFAEQPVFVDNENGLLGLALDPQFDSNGHVYVFATISTSEAQIIRFTESRDPIPATFTDSQSGPSEHADDAYAADQPPADASPWTLGQPGAAVQRRVIRDHLPTRGTYHSGGGLKVGPDGKLYFSIGDNLIEDNGQDMTSLAGKICRINLDGSTPTDNPFVTPTGTPRAIWALGFRNVFRFCFAPDGRIFAMDVGSDGNGRREEINLVRPGANYGWPRVEGRQGLFPNPRFTDPIYDYHDGGAAPVGAVYYTGQNFPPDYSGSLFYLEYVLNRVYRVSLAGDRAVGHELFYQAAGGVVDMLQGPDGCLYYSELLTGRIRRIAYVDKTDEPLDDHPDSAPGGDDALDRDHSPATGLCGFGLGTFLALTVVGLAAARLRPRRVRSPTTHAVHDRAASLPRGASASRRASMSEPPARSPAARTPPPAPRRDRR